MTKWTMALMGLTALSMGCKDKDCDSGGCDTGIDDVDADPTVSVSWPDDSTLEVTVADLNEGGVLGMAQTGAGGSGWYGEDCLDGICHPVINGTNTLTSVHPDVGGAGIDAVASGSTTLFEGSLHSNTTYAVFDAVTDECVYCNGEDCGYYTDVGC